VSAPRSTWVVAALVVAAGIALALVLALPTALLAGRGGVLALGAGGAMGLAWLGSRPSPSSRGEPRGAPGPIPLGVAIWIALVSTLLSAFLGLLATLLYQLEGPVSVAWTGLVVGAVAGALAGLDWLRWMQRRSVGCRRASFILRGVAGGVIVGSLASVTVHAAIALVVRSPEWWIGQLVGQGFAVVAGAVLGLAGGTGWNQRLPPPA
jgi:hypothetical protein